MGNCPQCLTHGAESVPQRCVARTCTSERTAKHSGCVLVMLVVCQRCSPATQANCVLCSVWFKCSFGGGLAQFASVSNMGVLTVGSFGLTNFERCAHIEGGPVYSTIRGWSHGQGLQHHRFRLDQQHFMTKLRDSMKSIYGGAWSSPNTSAVIDARV
eukprot:1289385-Amphidinium_carterae.1